MMAMNKVRQHNITTTDEVEDLCPATSNPSGAILSQDELIETIRVLIVDKMITNSTGPQRIVQIAPSLIN